MNDFDREKRFQIIEQIGVITKHKTGWAKEINIVSWNGGPPKWDIRDWSENHCFMSRGITLTEEEMEQLIKLMLDRKKTRISLQERIVEANGFQEQKLQYPQKENDQTVDR